MVLFSGSVGSVHTTTHSLLQADARSLSRIPSDSVHLVVTSPPYPMIQMWDETFTRQSERVAEALRTGQGNLAFEEMHSELDKVWSEVARVLCNGCFACINIGDATRSIGDRFRMYSNHSRIIQAFVQRGFDVLPAILWRKVTNAPNKFMGSGMRPTGAYVTLEHEFILIFRKGSKRLFRTGEAKRLRNASAFFWEERNQWFSDQWDVTGARQQLAPTEMRERNAAFPFEIPFRLIHMYSVYGDTVLDPFAGTGTTLAAAVASCRNSIGVEIDPAFIPVIEATLRQGIALGNERIAMRVRDHLAFVREYQRTKGDLKYTSECYGFPVMTSQETQISFQAVQPIEGSGTSLRARYIPWIIGMGKSDPALLSLAATEDTNSDQTQTGVSV